MQTFGLICTIIFIVVTTVCDTFVVGEILNRILNGEGENGEGE